MRSIDWRASTPLGSPAGWPTTLRMLVPIDDGAAAGFAMRVLRGRDDLVMLYNDAYRPVLGTSKHPTAMGRPTRESFAELWHVVGPLFDRVLAGESVALDDAQLPLDRHGYLEECFFTLSYSPLRDDAGGSIAGGRGRARDHGARDRPPPAANAARALGNSAVSQGGRGGGACRRRAREESRRHPAGARVPRTGRASPATVAMTGASSEAASVDWRSSPHRPTPPTRFRSCSRLVVDASSTRQRVLQQPLTQVRRAGPAGRVFHGAEATSSSVAIRDAGVDDYATFVELVAEQVASTIANAIADDERAQLMARERAARQDAETSSRTKDESRAIVSHELRIRCPPSSAGRAC